MGADLSPFPYALIYPQDEHERLLIDRLAEAGVQVERQTELVAFEETAAGVRARLKRADGATNACEAAYLAGCDGAHSTVREALGRLVFRAARTTISFTSPTSTRAAR